mgnify:CR=1 FL=1
MEKKLHFFAFQNAHIFNKQDKYHVSLKQK